MSNDTNAQAANERFLKAFFKYGLAIMLVVSLGLAYFSGAF
jgi:hypothetical protein